MYTCVINTPSSESAPPTDSSSSVLSGGCEMGEGVEGEGGQVIISGPSRGGRASCVCLGISATSEGTCDD